MYGTTASNPFDGCGAVVATLNREFPEKKQYRIYADLLQMHTSKSRETSSSAVSRMQPRERRRA
jgi:hypothetical protein